MLRPLHTVFGAVLAIAVVLSACGDDDASADRPTVVVTYSVLGAVVRDVVGDAAEVVVLMPEGTDPHSWSPSAKDIERINDASLVVANGLDLEEGLDDALDEAEQAGVPVFRAADHVEVRTLGDQHGEDEEAHGHEGGDPHLWLSARNMALVAAALTAELAELGVDVEASGAATVADLEALDADVAALVARIPEDRRKLVTGHESFGYFADDYQFELVGAVIPATTSQAEVSARQIVELKETIEAEDVPAIFVEIGTPTDVVKAIADETGVEVVELASHNLPADGTYRTYLLDIAEKIVDALA